MVAANMHRRRQEAPIETVRRRSVRVGLGDGDVGSPGFQGVANEAAQVARVTFAGAVDDQDVHDAVCSLVRLLSPAPWYSSSSCVEGGRNRFHSPSE
mgnify:CR=1 FL=1